MTGKMQAPLVAIQNKSGNQNRAECQQARQLFLVTFEDSHDYPNNENSQGLIYAECFYPNL